ncbi:uncharacterized protein PITG_01894 [Phytophthora infestans T30-4]|uniref:Exodeoxyribonuclease X-like C-terminal domain-containing protein n=1 Tax=Phytophthora infestans (strain T30-4) TaxID=403677 RepID=D0MUC5_PHYIT|nr:uncharacterized protein PITG_01894 [Phytophthora infestans T30-4]EEY61572.1 conserved hypothetical protein [Phytophthora infestans T30-4]|eukprot:XP_002908489.1 conserved hypothetical protein [Phytophthora infestans T30-4]
MSNELTFGKYKGTPIEEVYASDPGYCRWMHNQPSLNITENIKIFLHSEFLSNDNSYMMSWDKFKGKTLKQISRMDPNYIDWLRKSEFVIEKCPKLLQELN